MPLMIICIIGYTDQSIESDVIIFSKSDADSELTNEWFKVPDLLPDGAYKEIA